MESDTDRRLGGMMVSARQPIFKEMPGTAPDIMRDYNLATLGYEETEFSLEGRAVSYELQGERGVDGRWEVQPGPEAPFRTRFVARRPIDPARFSGTAVVEWHNVSAGIDAAPDWGFFHRHLAAQGHAWVGVSAQKVGIDGGGFVEGIHLILLAPERYSELEHPGDAWSFDMFTQVAALLKFPDNPLGGLVPERVIAAGESQSAACLVTYINAIDHHAQLFDAPVNAGPQQHYVSQAALGHLTRWAAEGEPPPMAPRLVVDARGAEFSADELGLAVGGIRTPWVDVPTAFMSGLGQTGETFAMLFGRTDPFDDDTLSSLYPGGKEDYLKRFEASLDATIAAGFILDDDRTEILGVAAAAASYPLRVIGT
jgi:hypothetical protein